MLGMATVKMEGENVAIVSSEGNAEFNFNGTYIQGRLSGQLGIAGFNTKCEGAALPDMQKRAQSHVLIPSPFEPDKPRDRSAIAHRLAAACKALGLGHVTPRGLRSNFAEAQFSEPASKSCGSCASGKVWSGEFRVGLRPR